MASSGDRKPGYVRRFVWLAVAIVAVIGLYSVGWHLAAGRLVDEVNAGVSALNRDGRRASCESAEARGYPFRIGVFCRSVLIEDARGGFAVRARQFRSAAQIYNPFHVIGELDGPATLEVPGLNALDLDWSSLRASVRLARPLPERVSVEVRDLDVRLDELGDAAPPLGTAERLEAHLRPAGDDLDLAVRFAGLRLAPEMAAGVALPPLDGLADVVIEDGAVDPPAAGLRGRAGTIRSATVALDEATGITVTGPVSVDGDGLVDADLQVRFRNPAAIGAILARLLPELSREIELSVASLSAMGDAPALPLRIVKGRMSLGFLSLGSIPSL